MKNLIALFSLALMFIATSCKSAKSTDTQSADNNATHSVAISVPLLNSKPVDALPKATAFRMTGDYANRVAITINDQGNLTYFPAPTDISPQSAPVALVDGWWLNRQGIGLNSVFTNFTFADYAALPKVPSIEELKASVIPGARVTEVMTLPYSINEAINNIPEINDYILEVTKK